MPGPYVRVAGTGLYGRQRRGLRVGIDDFDRIHRRVPVLADVKTTGRYPVEYFWYAGGVSAVMLGLREMLHLLNSGAFPAG